MVTEAPPPPKTLEELKAEQTALELELAREKLARERTEELKKQTKEAEETRDNALVDKFLNALRATKKEELKPVEIDLREALLNSDKRSEGRAHILAVLKDGSNADIINKLTMTGSEINPPEMQDKNGKGQNVNEGFFSVLEAVTQRSKQQGYIVQPNAVRSAVMAAEVLAPFHNGVGSALTKFRAFDTIAKGILRIDLQDTLGEGLNKLLDREQQQLIMGRIKNAKDSMPEIAKIIDTITDLAKEHCKPVMDKIMDGANSIMHRDAKLAEAAKAEIKVPRGNSRG